MHEINQIVAMTPERGIGLNGKLPWTLKAELLYFSKITTQYSRLPSDPPNVVIMGRKTWESIGKPLKNRINIILSRTKTLVIPDTSNTFVFNSIDSALEFLKTIVHSAIFIIGGSTLYSQTLPLCTKLFITRIHSMVKCDTFYPLMSDKEWTKLSSEETLQNINVSCLVHEENQVAYEYQVYQKILK
jgi:dihydrofolate reductase